MGSIVEHVLCIVIQVFFFFFHFVDSAKWVMACLDVWAFLDWCLLLQYSNAPYFPERSDKD